MYKNLLDVECFFLLAKKEKIEMTKLLKWQTLNTRDTELSADSVEFCPYPGYETLVAVGTYQIQENRSRLGRLYLYSTQDDAL
jgi:hypothetical protein